MTQAADDDFWERVRERVRTELAAPRILLLAKTHFRNATRWHRLTENNLDIIRIIRAALGPRALLALWAGPHPDVDTVLAAFPEDEPVDFVWEAATERSTIWPTPTQPTTSSPLRR